MADQSTDQTAVPESVPQSATVSTPPPAPIATEDAAPATAAVAPQAAPTAPEAGMDPAPQPNLAQKIYHGVLGALGGTQDVSYAIDPATQRLIATNTKAGVGTQWKRIIAGVVQGTAAGLSVPPGPAGLTRAAGAGMNAGMQGATQILAKKKQDVVDDADQDQVRLMRMAQTQALTYKNTTSAFEVSRLGLDAANHDTGIENGFNDRMRDNGGQDLGVAKNFDEVLAMHKDMPQLASEFARGNIVSVPHVNADGKYDGTRFGLVTPEWSKAKLSHDETYWHLVPPSKMGEEPTVEPVTVKAGSMSNGDFTNVQSSGSSQIMAWKTTVQKEKAAAEELANKEKGQNQRTAAQIAAANARAAQAQAGATERTGMQQAGANARATLKAGAPGSATPKQIATHDHDYVNPANTVEKSYLMMNKAYSDYKAAAAKGETLPTGAQSMLALSTHLTTTFGNVKGARITKDMIEHHLGARSISDSALVAFQKFTNGDALSPGQWEAFHSLIGESRFLSWETAAKEGARKGVPENYLPADLVGLYASAKPAPNPAAGAPAKGTAPAGAAPAPVKMIPGEHYITMPDKSIQVVRGGQWVPAIQ